MRLTDAPVNHLAVLGMPDLAQNKLLSAMYALTESRMLSPVLVPFTVCMLLLERGRIAKPLRT